MNVNLKKNGKMLHILGNLEVLPLVCNYVFILFMRKKWYEEWKDQSRRQWKRRQVTWRDDMHTFIRECAVSPLRWGSWYMSAMHKCAYVHTHLWIHTHSEPPLERMPLLSLNCTTHSSKSYLSLQMWSWKWPAKRFSLFFANREFISTWGKILSSEDKSSLDRSGSPIVRICISCLRLWVS